MSSSKLNPVTRLLLNSFNIKHNELKATMASLVMVFILMASYFILRPVRDAMASDWSDTEVSMLWNLQFFISAGIISLYGFFVSKTRFKYVVPMVYGLFASSFFIFYFIAQQLGSSELADKIFYVWISTFSLFNLSVFWSFMSDTFSKRQGKRLFAIIASGSSLGAIVGPMIPAAFAENLGIDGLMLTAAVGLMLAIPLIFYIYHLKTKELNNQDISYQLQKLGGQWWDGFKDVLSNRFLLSIAAFILLYVFIGSFVYFQQKNLLSEFSRPERTQILASIDWVVNSLTFMTAFFVTGRLLEKCGMALTLALIPMVICLGLLVLAFAPLVVILLAIQVTRRVGNYSVTRPARELLFTQVTVQQRFKAKPVIDTVVYRGGDAVSGTLFAVLSDGIGLGLSVIAIIGAGISALWGWLAWRIGLQYDSSETAETGKKTQLPTQETATDTQ